MFRADDHRVREAARDLAEADEADAGGLERARPLLRLAVALSDAGRSGDAAVRFGEVAAMFTPSERRRQIWLFARVHQARTLMMAKQFHESLTVLNQIIDSGVLISNPPGPEDETDYPLTVYVMREFVLDLLEDVDGMFAAASDVIDRFDPPETDEQRGAVATCVGVQARVYKQRGDIDSARLALEDVLRRSDGSDDEAVMQLRIGALVSLASLLEDLGETARARELYVEALDLNVMVSRNETHSKRRDNWLNRREDELGDRSVKKARKRVQALSSG